ncbi:MAG: hypothetical protein PHC34_01545 [Candidatus Gastranaerophilales bacterium]|nr:hypothetical protein [Candidatus Gastranaerophilales bacterium]
MKKQAKFIKTYSETPCLPSEEFWEGYRALISILVSHYKEENLK